MAEARSRRVNQSEIAGIAKVSISTVSRALGKAQGISPDVRDRVRRIASELGYSEKSSSGALKAVVYLPMHPVTGGLHQVFQEIFEGVQSAAAQEGIELFPRLLSEEDVDLACVTNAAQEAGTQAALVFYIDPIAEVADYFQQNGSMVIVNNVDPSMRFDGVTTDNYEGSRLATRQVLEHGHRSLLYVAGNQRYASRERLRGFYDAVGDIPGAKGDVISIGHDRQETAYEFFGRYFAEGRARDWTAMVCTNDLVALGIIHAARENGLSVPEDLSIIGFDNLGWSHMTTPRLATINIDRNTLGTEAVRLLKRRIEFPESPVMTCVVGVEYNPGGTIRRI